MPVVVTFDVAVTDRTEIERHLSVESEPAQPGTWHWISDNEVHWRPKTYWQPGTDVTVHADINGVDAGNGIYGQLDRTSSFTVGDAVVMKIDVAAHDMQVVQNGKLLRTVPISGGKPGFTTRSGIKVIMEKFRYKDMDAATTGISEGDAEYYKHRQRRVRPTRHLLRRVPPRRPVVGRLARVGERQPRLHRDEHGGRRLVVLADQRGDVVDVVGSDRPVESTNGYGDWNVSWADYRAGSALD